MDQEPTQIPAQKPKLLLVALIGAAILIAAAVAAYFLYVYEKPTGKLDLGIRSVNSYVCPDDSTYVIIRKDTEIIVSGESLPQIGASEPARFGNGGAVEFVISEEDLRLVTAGTNDAVITCAKEVPETGIPPLVL
jgi:hypothetical protein